MRTHAVDDRMFHGWTAYAGDLRRTIFFPVACEGSVQFPQVKKPRLGEECNSFVPQIFMYTFESHWP